MKWMEQPIKVNYAAILNFIKLSYIEIIIIAVFRTIAIDNFFIYIKPLSKSLGITSVLIPNRQKTVASSSFPHHFVVDNSYLADDSPSQPLRNIYLTNIHTINCSLKI